MPAASTPSTVGNAPVANPGMHPEVGASQPVSPARVIPRPPQPGMNRSSGITDSPANVARPQLPIAAPATRPVPRPPQIERTANPEVSSPARPTTPPSEQPARANNPNPAQPLRGPMPNAAQPSIPRGPQIERTPNTQAAAPVRPAAPQQVEPKRTNPHC